MKHVLLLLVALAATSAIATQPPQRAPQTETLQQHMRLLESQMSKAAIASDSWNERLKKIGDQLDSFTKAIHGLRLQIEGKQNSH